MPRFDRSHDLPISLELRIDSVCRRYEAELQAGRAAAPDDFVNGWSGKECEALLGELRLIEAEYRPGIAGTRSVVPPPKPTNPDRVGDFRLIRLVGKGGMGVVYEAFQESLGRRVALKLLPPMSLVDPIRLERFRREAKAAARLHHTNIVPVFGTGEAGNQHFYAMQFIDGSSLDVVIQGLRSLKRGLPDQVDAIAIALETGTFTNPSRPDETEIATRSPNEAERNIAAADTVSHSNINGVSRAYWMSLARIGAQAADALAYAHDQGVLHRDIKPANLLLDPRGTVWVTDFGLAKSTEANDLTQTGDILGTLRYMAPERFEGQGDARADVYALGLTLYELLTLRPAFAADSRAKLVEQVLTARPTRPRALNPDIPLDLETIVLKSIANDPEQRYKSATEMADDLRRFQEDRQILARRATLREQVVRWCRRNPAVAVLLAAVLLVSTLGTVFTLMFAIRADTERANAVNREQEALAANRDGQEKLLQSLMSEARASRLSRRTGQRFDTLKTIRKASALAHQLKKGHETYDELRNLAVSAFALPDIRSIGELALTTESCVIDPSSLEKYAYQAQDKTFILARIPDGAQIERVSGVESLEAWTFSPDGSTIYIYSAKDGILSWKVGTGKTDLIFPPKPNNGVPYSYRSARLSVTRDGKRLLRIRCVGDFVGAEIAVHELPSGREIYHYDSQGEGGYKNTWRCDLSPDGKWLALVGGQHADELRRNLMIVEVDTGRVVRNFPHRDSICAPIWLPDCNTVALGMWNETTIYLHDCTTGQITKEFHDLRGGEPQLWPSKSGQLLVGYSNWAGTMTFWHPQTGEVLFQRHAKTYLGVPLSDGRIAGYERVEGKLRLWATEPSPVFRTITPCPGERPLSEMRYHAVHPRGRLATCGTSNGVALLDLDTGMSVGLLNLGLTLFARFDPVTGDLFTYGTCGLHRWPVKIEDSNVRIGPPHYLQPPGKFDSEFDLSEDGRTIVASRYSTARVFDSLGDSARLPRMIGPFDQARKVMISSDGHCVLGIEHLNGGSKYYDARSGAVATKADYVMTPSPTTPYVCQHRSGDNTLEFRVKGADRPAIVFENADPSASGFPILSPDGAQIIVGSLEKYVVHVWDLREIRRLLTELDLDWDGPAFPPAPPTPVNGKYSIPQLSVRVIAPEQATDVMARNRAIQSQAVLDIWANPFDANAHYQLGVNALCEHRREEARTWFDRALAIRPDHEGACSRRADIAWQQERFVDAISDADRALASGSKDVPTNLTRIKSLMALQRYSEAISSLTVLLNFTPRDWRLLELRAICFQSLGRNQEASADQAAATRFSDALQGIVLNEAAWQLMTYPDRIREDARALDLITRAITRTPDDPTLLNTLGVAQYRLGKYTEARTTLEKSLAASKGEWDASDLYFLAMCHAKLGSVEQARQLLEKANAWTEANKRVFNGNLNELAAFRNEAESMLREPK